MATNADMIEDSQVHTFNAEIAIMYNQGYKSSSGYPDGLDVPVRAHRGRLSDGSRWRWNYSEPHRYFQVIDFNHILIPHDLDILDTLTPFTVRNPRTSVLVHGRPRTLEGFWPNMTRSSSYLKLMSFLIW